MTDIPETEVNHEELERKSLKKIKEAWVAGVILVIFKLAGIAANFSSGKLEKLDPMELVDVVAISGLTYGVFKRSRASAILLLVYFVGGKAFSYFQTGKINGLIMVALFAYCFVLGVIGTLGYFKATRQAA